MQKVTLEIDSPFMEHRNCWLRDEQIFQVGASSLMDLGIPGDHYLNEHHFSIQLQQGRCAILDHGTVNGTWVNGKRIECTWLNDGDTIHAGQSTFRLRIQGAAAAQSNLATVPMTQSPSSQPVADQQWVWEAEELSTGTYVCRPIDGDEFSTKDLIQRLPSDVQPYLVVDRQELGWNVERTHPFLNGAPELMPFVSLYATRDRKLLQEKIDEVCVDAKALIVCSRQPFDQLVRQLHQHATSFSSSELFASQVIHSPAPFATALTQGLDAIIWLDEAAHWKMVMHADPEVQWQRLSMPRGPRQVTRLQSDEVEDSSEENTESVDLARSA